MRANWFLVLLVMAAAIPARADDSLHPTSESQQPDVALLEYLGEWAGNNNRTDPVDILDMKIDDSKKDDKAKVSEKQDDS